MNVQEVMQQLEQVATERTKKIYVSNGAKEPVFGVATSAMKPLFKKIKLNQPLAEQLYATGNYDAMYFAGMIAEPLIMTAEDFDRWMETAYFYMLSDYVVAVTLAESPLAEQIAMIQFLKAVAISYEPLHKEATDMALQLGDIKRERVGKKPLVLNAYPEIEKAIEKGRIGFKRKHVRC